MMMDLSNKASFFTGNPILDSRADMTIETRRKIFAKFGDSFIAHCLLVHTLELRTITNLHDSLLFRGITDLRNKVELVRKALVTGCTQSVKANVLQEPTPQRYCSRKHSPFPLLRAPPLSPPPPPPPPQQQQPPRYPFRCHQ
jgi:hypothetical protein